MSKETEARKAQLESQLQHAVVEHIGTEANDYPSFDVGTYSVFVPGAIREHNIVKADSEAEAIEKVKANLEFKLDNWKEPTENVDLDPQNIKLPVKGKQNG